MAQEETVTVFVTVTVGMTEVVALLVVLVGGLLDNEAGLAVVLVVAGLLVEVDEAAFDVDVEEAAFKVDVELEARALEEDAAAVAKMSV